MTMNEVPERILILRATTMTTIELRDAVGDVQHWDAIRYSQWERIKAAASRAVDEIKEARTAMLQAVLVLDGELKPTPLTKIGTAPNGEDVFNRADVETWIAWQATIDGLRAALAKIGGAA